jgi:hypothetical protein
MIFLPAPCSCSLSSTSDVTDTSDGNTGDAPLELSEDVSTSSILLFLCNELSESSSESITMIEPGSLIISTSLDSSDSETGIKTN